MSFTPAEIKNATAYYNYKQQGGLGEEQVGISAFARNDAGEVFHTYSTYSRGVDMLNGAYHYMDIAPKGRDEAGHGDPQYWVRRRDEYDR